MSTFADTSALVKLYVEEAGSEVVSAVPHPIVVSQVARVEVPAALWRIQRAGRARTAAVATATGGFVADYAGTASASSRFVVVRLTDAILADAATLTDVRALRAYDAVQLATACAAARADNRVRTFAAFGNRLRDAAGAEGFTLVPRDTP